ncbi:MAG: carboxypeptidase regulatory-like domain-containing protein [Gemmatimonadetes bacterium]|nr:carboxypeptidase regulatory-like domain-containing protein [Gemmatimonadota bacterium]
MKRALLLVLLLFGLVPAGLRAQRAQVRGHVIDSAGRPVPDQAVLLHRVIGSSGASIGQARTDSAGTFAITVDSAGNREAVYFVATRWRAELYISDPFQTPLDQGEHVLQVGMPGTSATAMLEGTAPAAPGTAANTPAMGTGPAGRTSWLVYFAVAVILLGLASYFMLRSQPGLSERRRLLVRIADLDLKHGGTPDQAYQDERAALVSRLREMTGP